MSQEPIAVPQINTLWRLYQYGKKTKCDNITCFMKFRRRWHQREDGSLLGIWAKKEWTIDVDGVNEVTGRIVG